MHDRIAIGALTLVAMATGCRGAGSLPLEPVEAPAQDVEALVAGNNRFAIDLYHQFRAGKGNRFFSPFSVAAALAMTSAGAAGDTADEMAATLGTELPPDRRHVAFHAHLYALAPPGGRDDVELSIANGLWTQQGHPFLAPFTDTLKEHYGAKAHSLDFAGDPDGARREINGWVAGQTRDRIQDLFPEGGIDTLTRLVLASAIYFKGSWDEEFDPDDSKDEPFHLGGGEEKTARFMHQKKHFRFAGLDGLSVLELPYDGKRVALVVVLPDEVDGLAKLEEGLTAEKLEKWLSKLRSREVVVSLPRFRFTASADLVGPLSALGMPGAFTADADFSSMDGMSDLFIQTVRHKAFVQVDEEGTEAAAATGFAVGLEAIPGTPPVFRADHPFLFLVRDNESGAILFLGRLVDPVEEP